MWATVTYFGIRISNLVMEGIFYVNMYLKPLEHQIIVVSSI